MSCCAQAEGAARFFSLFARRYRKRYQARGLERSQRQLLDGLSRAGYAGASMLEIGSGVGYLHQTLLEQGAGSAVGVDLSAAMLAQARDRAQQRGLEERTRYVQGDFVEIASTLDETDVVILDKVVCCYPDVDGLVRASLAKTRRVYALTYPRDRWYVRAGVAATALVLWLLRSTFRSYVHDPRRIAAAVGAAGFRKVHERHTPVWLTEIYVKE